MSSKKRLVVLATMIAILVLGIAIPAAAQLNTGNVQNAQGVVRDGSTAGGTSLTGANTGSTAGNGTDIEEACQHRIIDVLRNEFGITVKAEEENEKLVEELCDDR